MAGHREEARGIVSGQRAYRKGCDQQPVAGIQRKQSSYRKSVRVPSVEEEVDAAGNMPHPQPAFFFNATYHSILIVAFFVVTAKVRVVVCYY